MARETRSIIPFEEFSNDVVGFFERVVRGHETVVVENEAGEAAILKPAPLLVRGSGKRIPRHKRTTADRETFLSSLGGWKDLVDTDKLIENIYESRSISTRPPVRL